MKGPDLEQGQSEDSDLEGSKEIWKVPSSRSDSRQQDFISIEELMA